MDNTYLTVCAILACLHYGDGALRFANSFGDHMVLQRAPRRALLWGYADTIGDTVTVLKNAVPAGSTTVYRNPSGAGGMWKLKLPAESSHGPYTIMASSSEGHVTMNDVMFGDVWICSGQSNMQFKMEELIDAAREINNAVRYQNVRMLFSDFVQSATPLDDVKVRMPWVPPIKGESNAGHSDMYACQFPAMIADWRQQFHTGTDGETDTLFPFGFVQLAPFRPGDVAGGFPALRWAQTAQQGHAPNSRMPNTFMAVAIDLPDFQSTSGQVHPRYKQDVADRLALASREFAYHQTNVDSEGPFPTLLVLDTLRNELILTYDNGTKSLQVRTHGGFEICCAHSATSDCGSGVTWSAADIVGYNSSSVRVHTSVCTPGTHPAGIRYLWKESPCALKQCPIYGAANSLPAPPYLHTGGFPPR